MNLLNLLVRDMYDWPNIRSGCDSITQDSDGGLNTTCKGGKPYFHEQSGEWNGGVSGLDIFLESADDYATAIVTEWEWQAELYRANSNKGIYPTEENLQDPAWWDANAPEGAEACIDLNCYSRWVDWNEECWNKRKNKWVESDEPWSLDKYLQEESFSVHVRPIASVVNEYGLPPVGVEFEFSYQGSTWGEHTMLFNDGITCLIADLKYPANRWHYKSVDTDMRFRPIQNERDKFISGMKEVIRDSVKSGLSDGMMNMIAEGLYDTGYILSKG